LSSLYCVNNYCYKCEDNIQIVIMKRWMKHLTVCAKTNVSLVNIVHLI
jgi:hypothetical protein